MPNWITYLKSNKRHNSIFAIISASIGVIMCILILYHTSIGSGKKLSIFGYIVIIGMCIIAIRGGIYTQLKILHKHYIEYKIKYLPGILIDHAMGIVNKIKSLGYAQ